MNRLPSLAAIGASGAVSAAPAPPAQDIEEKKKALCREMILTNLRSHESLIPDSHLTPVSSPSVVDQSSKTSPATDVDSPPSAASATPVSASATPVAASATPADDSATPVAATETDSLSPPVDVTLVLQKEESKEETDDDKFDENDSQCDETSPSPEAVEPVAEKTLEEIANDRAAREASEIEKRKKREEALDQQMRSPRQKHAPPAELSPEEQVSRKIRALVNKITPTSKESLTKEFIIYNVSSNDEQLGQVVDIILDKAFKKPIFSSRCAELCKAQVDHEIRLTNGKSAFRNKVLTRTQMTFQDRSEFDEERMAIIEKEEDPAKRELLKIEERQKFRRRRFGVIAFIGHLYRNHLLFTKIVQACTFELFASILPKKVGGKEQELKKEDIDEESVHHGLKFIETVGAMVDRSEDSTTAFLDQWFQKLDTVLPLLSERNQVKLQKIKECRSTGWVTVISEKETVPPLVDDWSPPSNQPFSSLLAYD